MPAKKPKGRSKAKLNTSQQSGDSSYRDSISHYSEEELSSRESSPRSHRTNESRDETDFVHHMSGSSETSFKDFSSNRGSPYSKLREELNDLSSQYEWSDSLPSHHPNTSPDVRARRRLSSGELEFNAQGLESLGRRALHDSRQYRSPEKSKEHQYTRKKNSTSQGFIPQEYHHICMICSVILVLMFFVFVIRPMFTSAPEKIMVGTQLDERELLVRKFEKEFKTFMGLFPAQGTRFWKILKSSTNSVLKEKESIKPVILIIVSNSGAHDTAACLTKRFAQLITKVYGAQSPVDIHKRDILQYSDPNKLKKYIDVTLQDGFQMSKVAVIHDIDHIHGEAAMIFHSYCDNEFAPYKDAAILFTIQNDGYPMTVDSDVEDYLDERWENDLDKDKRAALLYSRIANNVAFVKKEDDLVIKNICA